MSKERNLVLRVQTLGDTEAFSALVRIHQSRIRAFLLRLSKNYDHADDLAQETFIKAYQNMGKFRNEGKFGSWLFAIAYRTFLEQQRSAGRRDEITEEFRLQFEVVAEKYDSISTAQLDLEQALAQLSEQQAAAITLCHSMGFSHREAAEILNTPLGTVKTDILRGKEELTRLLTQKTQAHNAS